MWDHGAFSKLFQTYTHITLSIKHFKKADGLSNDEIFEKWKGKSIHCNWAVHEGWGNGHHDES